MLPPFPTLEPRPTGRPIVPELLQAALELIRSEVLVGPVAKVLGLESISRTAGENLFALGAVPSVDVGIVVFHAQITRDKPALRRILRRADIKAGRIKARKRSPAQKLVAQAVKAGAVTRTKTGQLKAINPLFRRKIKAAQVKARKEATAKRKRREKAVLKRLGVRR